MSKYFAVIEDGLVINAIFAETKTIAETVTQKVCVEYDLDSDNTPHIGFGYADGVFEKPYIPTEDVIEEEVPTTE